MLSVAATHIPHTAAPVFTKASVIRNIVIDCSGSMSGEVRDIRGLLKTKIPQVTQLGDRLNILTFSSRNDCQIVVADFEVTGASDFKILNQQIDKHVYARGCTGFVDPIAKATEITLDIKSANPEKNFLGHMFFMTDGCDNCWREHEIIQTMEDASKVLDSITLVEFGWYCNRPLLTRMADAVGATQIFSENFEKYDGAFTENLVKAIGPGTKKVPVSLPGKPLYDFAFYIDQNSDVVAMKSDNAMVMVPEQVETVYSLIDTAQEGAPELEDTIQLAAVYLLAQRMKSNEVLDLLGRMGDVALIDAFQNCFSKQDYSDFQAVVLAQLKDPALRYAKGKDTRYLPADDAYTVVDMLEELTSSSENKLYPHDPAFKYERISAARVESSTVITDEEKEALMQQIKDAKTPEEVKKASEALTSGKVTLKFNPHAENAGYPLRDLVYNEKRPNISVAIKVPGYVEIPKGSPFDGVLPARIDTFRHRNYAVVHDGVKHSSLRNLPVSLSEESYNALVSNGVIPKTDAWEKGKIFYLNANLPVMNRKMMKNVSAKEFFTQCIELISMKSQQKVFNTLLKNLTKDDEISGGFADIYGVDAATWLESAGLTPGGFAPLSVKGESTDEYVASEFKVLVGGCSAIPTINDALIAKVKSGKLLPSVALCAPALQRFWVFEESDAVKNALDPVALKKAWLESELAVVRKNVRTLMRDISKTKMAIMVGHTWFTEFASLDENKMDVTVNGVTYTCTADLREITVKI